MQERRRQREAQVAEKLQQTQTRKHHTCALKEHVMSGRYVTSLLVDFLYIYILADPWGMGGIVMWASSLFRFRPSPRKLDTPSLMPSERVVGVSTSGVSQSGRFSQVLYWHAFTEHLLSKESAAVLDITK